jgi:hypothetical protein
VDAQDLLPPGSVRQVNLDVDFESSGAEYGLVEQVLAVGHADDDDVVERLHSVDVGEQLVDHLVAHLRPHPAVRSPLLADRVDLVEHDDVQRTLVPHLPLVRTRLREQLADVLLGLSHELAEYLWTVDDLQVLHVEGAGQLSGDQRLTSAGRTVQQDPLHVLDTEPLQSGS